MPQCFDTKFDLEVDQNSTKSRFLEISYSQILIIVSVSSSSWDVLKTWSQSAAVRTDLTQLECRQLSDWFLSSKNNKKCKTPPFSVQESRIIVEIWLPSSVFAILTWKRHAARSFWQFLHVWKTSEVSDLNLCPGWFRFGFKLCYIFAWFWKKKNVVSRVLTFHGCIFTWR